MERGEFHGWVQVPMHIEGKPPGCRFNDVPEVMRRVLDMGHNVIHLYGWMGNGHDTLYIRSWPARIRPLSGSTRHQNCGHGSGGLLLKGGDRIRLGAGHTPQLVELKVDKMPEEDEGFSPRLWLSDDPKAELDRWLDFGRRVRPYLENAVKCASDTLEGKKARRVLDSL